MKIVHVITTLLDGGAEGVLYRLCKQDKSNKHVVISLRGKGKYGPLLLRSGIKVHCLNMKPKFFSLYSCIKLIRLFKIYKPDVVQTWLYHADFIGGLFARISGVKNIVWGIRHSNFEFSKSKKFIILLVKILAKLSYWVPKLIILCAKKSIKVHESIGYDKNKMRLIRNGYDTTVFKPFDNKKSINFRKKFQIKAKTPILGSVGRFHPQKDHDNLFKALAILNKKKIDYFCLLVGFEMDSCNEDLVHKIKKMKLENKVKLLGSQNDIPQVMRELDLHILPSAYGESFPNVVAESMACGTPCVVTDVGDAAFIVGNTGWVVPPKNSEALANKIMIAIRKLNDKKWSSRCAEARKRIKKNFSIDLMVKNYIKVWREIQSKDQL
jgi:glycosyltransferase involved in cell wall biosynthesis